jgi:hypothetical protein
LTIILRECWKLEHVAPEEGAQNTFLEDEVTQWHRQVHSDALKGRIRTSEGDAMAVKVETTTYRHEDGTVSTFYLYMKRD